MAPVRPANIKGLHSFLERQLKTAVVLNSEVIYLTAPGDNYGSETLKITATVKWTNKPEESSVEVLHLVAKQPPKNEMFYEWFQPQLTCHKENNAYLSISPAIKEFQLLNNVPKADFLDIFAKCYGCRCALDETTDIIDRDALLVLENLYPKGYYLGDRMTGFDEKSTEIIIKSLAKFHALPIAMRQINPTQFDDKIRPHLNPLVYKQEDDEFSQKMWDSIFNVLKTNEFSEQTLEILRISFMSKKTPWIEELPDKLEDRPWNTIAHRDFWVNNLMVGYDQDGNPKDIKMLDFQIYSYHTVVLDVIFFLFSSTDYSFLKHKFHDLLKLYHDQFILTLTQVGCPIKDFSFESFMKEVEEYARYEVNHILFMLRPIMTKKEMMPETTENLDFDSFVSVEVVGDDYKTKVLECVRMFEEFGIFGPMEYYKKFDSKE